MRYLVAVLLLLGAPPDDQETRHEGLTTSQSVNAGGLRTGFGGGFGLVAVRGQVEKCHPQCKKCHLFDYDLSWHCLECYPGYELWVDGCFAPCPAGQYRYGYKCEKCFANCAKCVGGMAHECQECSNGFVKDFRSLCTRQCGTGRYATVDGLTCEGCDSYCRECIAGSRISCRSCFAGFTLRIIDETTQTGECMRNCEKGFFRDESRDLRCIQCGKYCADCESLYKCFECEPGCTLFRGICYLIPTGQIDQTIDFDTYLNSGAGKAWDDSEQPNWGLLTGQVRRLQSDPLYFDPSGMSAQFATTGSSEGGEKSGEGRAWPHGVDMSAAPVWPGYDPFGTS